MILTKNGRKPQSRGPAALFRGVHWPGEDTQEDNQNTVRKGVPTASFDVLGIFFDCAVFSQHFGNCGFFGPKQAKNVWKTGQKKNGTADSGRNFR